MPDFLYPPNGEPRSAANVFTEKVPVLHFGRVPDYGDLSGWDFRVSGEVAEPFTVRWAEFR